MKSAVLNPQIKITHNIISYKYSKEQNLINSRVSSMYSSTEYTYCLQTWCVFVRASLHMSREEKPARCHCMLYCTYDTLNVFRALLCPSSGALDYMYAIAAYGVQCLAAGCRGQVQGSRVCVQEVGCCTTASCSIPLPGRTPGRPAPDPRQPTAKHCTPQAAIAYI
jgi:hypothetical protein